MTPSESLPPPPPCSWIVFTDLDGTLLDHDDYSFAKAKPALAELDRLGIPLVLATSKTRLEVRELRKKLGNRQPSIVENGGALVLPQPDGDDDEEQVIVMGIPYAIIREKLDRWREAHGRCFEGFGDWNAQGVVQHTGLPLEDAERALDREGSEPIIWLGDDTLLASFRRDLEGEGLRLLQGGRFLHVMGDTDKGKACRRLLDQEGWNGEGRSFVVALGDSANDRQMLEMADVGVVVRRSDGSHLEIAGNDRTLQTTEMGPAGWNRAVLDLLHRANL